MRQRRLPRNPEVENLYLLELAITQKQIRRLEITMDDAVLMGVDETAMRGVLIGMIEGLESPKRAGR